MDGSGRNASFDYPAAIAYDTEDDAFFIADAGSNTIRRYDSTGRVQTIAGACDRELLMASCVGREIDGIRQIARFDRPSAIAYDPKLHGLLVFDSGASALRFVTPDGRVRTVGHASDIVSLAIDAKRDRWYAAQRQAVVTLFRDDSRVLVIRLWTAPGHDDGRDAPISSVNAVAVDSQTGDIFAAVHGTAVYRLRLGATEWQAELLAGNPAPKYFLFRGGADGRGGEASFAGLAALAFDENRRLLMAVDSETIRSIALDGTVKTDAGGCEPQADPRYRGEFACDYPAHDGTGSKAHFGWPVRSIAIDCRHNRVLILDEAFLREMDMQGSVTTVAGNSRAIPYRTWKRWTGRYVDTITGEALGVFVNGDEEIEVSSDASGHVFDVRRGLRSQADDVAQFWTPPSYVRVGEAGNRRPFNFWLNGLKCGWLLDHGQKNPIDRGYSGPSSPESLFMVWYRSFSRGQIPRYFESRRCVALRVIDARGRTIYEDYESRVTPHALPDGLIEYADARRLYTER